MPHANSGALRGQFIVANSGQREAVTRAQQHKDRCQGSDRQKERKPIHFEFAHLSARRHCEYHRCRKTDSGTTSEDRDLRREQPEYLGHDPCPDRKVGATQAKNQQGHWNGDQSADRAGYKNRQDRIDIEQHRQREQNVAAETDESLLADRDKSCISGEQVPQACQRDECEHLGKQPQRLPVAPVGRQGEHDQCDGDEPNPDTARTCCVFDNHPDTFGNRPCGRTARMARNTM